jgi:hypothetical protein
MTTTTTTEGDLNEFSVTSFLGVNEMAPETFSIKAQRSRVCREQALTMLNCLEILACVALGVNQMALVSLSQEAQSGSDFQRHNMK